MAEKVRVWFDAEGDYLEVRFSDSAGFEKETKHDAVMERVDKDGIFNNTRLRWRVTRAAQPPPAWFSSTRDLVLGANWSLVICSEREPTGNIEEPNCYALLPTC